MGRIFVELEVNGNKYHTLFDSGARGNYIVKSATAGLPKLKLPKPIERKLGGETFIINEACLLVGTIEGYGITATTMVVDKLFADENGREIEIIIGAETMELWGIGLDMANRRLDFTHYAKESIEG